SRASVRADDHLLNHPRRPGQGHSRHFGEACGRTTNATATRRRKTTMSLPIRTDACAFDFLALGALVHRLDPGVVPFRKARSLDVHVSGGEYNVAANLADCFGLKTAVATAMVDYGIGELVQARVREAGVTPYYKRFVHDGVRGPN